MIRTNLWHLPYALLAAALILTACGDNLSTSPVNDAGMSDSGEIDGGESGLCADVDCSALDDDCNTGVCNPADGTCMAVPRPNGTTCDDSDLCTTNDFCVVGVCSGAAVDCSGSSDQCNMGMCNPADGSCMAMPIADGTACDDASLCTTDDVCTAGVCGGAAVDCSALGDACNDGVCNPADGSCMAMPVADGTTCDDTSLCTTGDICTAGVCSGAAVDCSGSSDQCNMGMCNPADGSCMAMPIADGTTCDDASLCTTGDVCTAGVCSGAAVDCSALGDACNDGVCNPADGSCMAMPVADGTTCDDGDLCSAGVDTCVAGVCGLGETTDSDVTGSFIYSVDIIPDIRPTPANTLQLADNSISAALPIGFDFRFFGTTFRSLYVSSNGFITFTRPSSSACCGDHVLPNPSLPRNLIALYWEDLNPAAGGTVTYGTTGTAPERELVVMFTDVPHAVLGGGSPHRVTAQLVLHEGTNDIELICIDCPSDGGLHTQGIQNSTGTVAYTMPGRNNRNFSLEDDAALVMTATSSGPDGYSDTCDTCIGISNPDQMPDVSGGGRALVTSVIAAPRALTSPTALTLGEDEVSAAIPIGFEFRFFGVPQTELRISSNGFITFSDTTEHGCCAGQTLPTPAEPNNLIALYWEDLDPTAGGAISYELRGTAPNREFVVDFDNVPHFGSATAPVTGQIVLREAGSEIEIICTSCPFAAGTNPHTQGVEDAMGDYGKTRRGRNGTEFSLASDGVRFQTFAEESVCTP